MRMYAVVVVLLCGCSRSVEVTVDAGRGDGGMPFVCGVAPQVERAWSSDEFEGCVLASLLEYRSQAGAIVVAASGDGRVTALDPTYGKSRWSVKLPARRGEQAYVVATPVITPEGRLVVTWQDIQASKGDPLAPRTSHRVAVIDLERGTLDPAFPTLTLAARVPASNGTDTVVFAANNALSRARLLHAPGAPGSKGFVYIGLGNARDIQPWHGWMFELDLDAWHALGAAAAIRSVLLTTPETVCGKSGVSGSRDMICGAGIWAPAGPELVATSDGSFDLLIPTGNGALELGRRNYAHTVMRVHGPGLSFDPGCDERACADWDVLNPSAACMASCRDLFIPRRKAGDTSLLAPQCEGLSFFECYAKLDWDLGANAPAVVDIPDGPRTLLLPAKDGSLYLIDYAHLGTMLDRLPIVNACGTGGAKCSATWPGMMVTRPEVSLIDGVPVAVVGTFNFDNRNAAGLVGVRVVMRDGKPRLEKAWEAPAFDTAEAVAGFRKHPSRVRLLDYEGERYATVVDQVGPSGHGELYLVRIADGAIRRKVELAGPGQRYTQPLWLDATLFVTSCDDGQSGPSHVEAWRMTTGCP